MRQLLIAILVLAAGCARQTRPEPKPGQATGPELLRCAQPHPLLSEVGRRTAPPPPEGKIVAEFDVDPSGKVRDVHVSPSGPFADALERHLKSCRYSPAIKDGRPAQEHITLSYGRLD